MNPYTLTLLRHGDIDHQGRLIGHTDLPLTERGRTDMAASWQRIVQLAPVTCMATSPLQRCREFAVQQALASQNFELVWSTPAAFARFLDGEMAKWDKAIKQAGIQPD